MKGIEQFVQVDAATLGALKYAGTWNASTNTPTLASGVGVQGQYYVVSVAGSTNLDGVTNWGVGDWAVFNGTVWQRVEGGADGNFVNLSVTGTATVSGTAEFADGLAASPSITNIGDTNTGMYFPSADAIGIVTGGVNRIRVTSAGDVGIGTTTPAVKLDVANGFVVVGANTSNPGVGGNMRFRDDTGASRWLSGLLGGAGATAYSIYDIIAGAERLTINSTGDVGIGTGSPSYTLDVRTSASNAVRVGSSSNAFGSLLSWDNPSGESRLMSIGAYALVFGTNTTERMRIDSSGNVGIGTSSPATKLHVNTGAAGYGITVAASSQTSITYQIGIDSSSNLAVYDTVAAAQRLVLSTAGNLGLGVTPSAWDANFRAYQAGSAGYAAFVGDQSNGRAEVLNNCYASGASTYTYSQSLGATRYSQQLGIHAWYTAGSGTAGNAISFTQAMTLDASGDFIIGGTTTNSIRLTAEKSNPTRGIIAHVSNTGSSSLTGSQIMFTQNTVNNWAVGQPAGVDAFAFWSGRNTAADGTERMRIDSSGNLLVGKTTASGTTVGPELLANGQINSATADLDNLNIYNTTAAAYRFYVNAAGTVFATNTTISAISDQRLKENVQDLDAGLDKIMALKPRKFDWKSGKGKDIKGDRGFIAQEFGQVFPDLIDEWKDPASEGEEPYKSVRQDLIPVLVKAIQELNAKVQALEAQLGA